MPAAMLGLEQKPQIVAKAREPDPPRILHALELVGVITLTGKWSGRLEWAGRPQGAWRIRANRDRRHTGIARVVASAKVD
jgi:hypothetical protein